MKSEEAVTVTPISPGKPTQLDEQSAKALDEKIRAAGKKFTDSWFYLSTLLKEAEQGQIHKALGFSSWTAYVADAVKIAPTDSTERKMLAELMSGEGMSQRAIAAVLDVDQKTVSNDLRSGEESSSAVTVGRDGKSYPRQQLPNNPRQRVEKSSVERFKSRLRRLTNLAGESDEKREAFVTALCDELRPMGLKVVEVEA